MLCDSEVLDTLPPEEMRSGLGEMAKYHFIADADLDSLNLPERIARCVEIKAEVVAADERESGRRAVLNYGHTLAHALEAHGGYDLRHGEAVAVGLIYAAELAHRTGRVGPERVAEHRRVVGGYELPTSLPQGADADAIVGLFGRDKKAVDGVTFMLDGPEGIQPVTGLEPALLREALEAIR